MKETPRTLPNYYERPKAEYPKEVREVVYVARKEPVYESSTVILSAGEYTWGEHVGCEDMRVGGGEEGSGGKTESGGSGSTEKVEEAKKKESEVVHETPTEAKGEKEGGKDGNKDKGKGLKKSDVNEWRNSVRDPAPKPEGPEAGDEESEAGPSKKRKCCSTLSA